MGPTHIHNPGATGCVIGLDHGQSSQHRQFTEPYWLLFDLKSNEPERYSMARKHPDVVQRLSQEIARVDKAFRLDATHDRDKTYPE
tara:strand:+ start:136362 stop:136619 length:258 start_codon:yes stop_codon:yes gene_type:complete